MWFYSAEKWYSTENFDTRYLRFYSAEKWYLSKKITSCFFDFARQKSDIYQKKKYKWFCNFNRRKSDIYQKITGGFRNFLSIKLIFISKKLLVFFLCGGWGLGRCSYFITGGIWLISPRVGYLPHFFSYFTLF